MTDTVFFMGANAPEGFSGLFGEFQTPRIRRLYILKGGPGNGKSTCLGIIADEARRRGLCVERIPCASDPGSLDGVYLPERGLAWVDGTSPHVAEPKLPGARDTYVNLGALWDMDALEREAEPLRALFDAYAKAQRTASRWIRAAGAAYENLCALPESVRTEKLERRARGIIAREFPGKKKTARGVETRRFLSGITPEGQLCRYDTAFALCTRVYELADPFGTGTALLETLREAALGRGLAVIACGHPLCPEKLSHLLVPEAGAGFVTSDTVFTCDREPYRRLRLEPLAEGVSRPAFREHRKLLAALLGEANRAQREAREIHDRIEAHYNPTVDFDALRRFAHEHARQALD